MGCISALKRHTSSFTKSRILSRLDNVIRSHCVRPSFQCLAIDEVEISCFNYVQKTKKLVEFKNTEMNEMHMLPALIKKTP